MTNRFNTLLSWDAEDRLWVAYVPSLNWLSTYGKTKEEAMEQVTDAIIGYLEAAAKEGIEAPPGDSDAELRYVEVAAR